MITLHKYLSGEKGPDDKMLHKYLSGEKGPDDNIT